MNYHLHVGDVLVISSDSKDFKEYHQLITLLPKHLHDKIKVVDDNQLMRGVKLSYLPFQDYCIVKEIIKTILK